MLLPKRFHPFLTSLTFSVWLCTYLTSCSSNRYFYFRIYNTFMVDLVPSCKTQGGRMHTASILIYYLVWLSMTCVSMLYLAINIYCTHVNCRLSSFYLISCHTICYKEQVGMGDKKLSIEIKITLRILQDNNHNSWTTTTQFRNSSQSRSPNRKGKEMTK